MPARDTIRSVGGIFGKGHRHPHWLYESGVPGWTRTEGGYPCLHWADMHFPRIYDKRHELDLLIWEAGELEKSLAEVRDRIKELDTEREWPT